MANTQSSTKWWGSSGFWNGLVLAVSGLFVGFPTGAASDAVSAIFALVTSGMAIRSGLSGKHPDWRAWLANKNTWNYLGATIVAILPTVPVGLFQEIGNAVSAALGGNWQGILVAVFSIGTMIYYWLRPKPASA